MPLTEVADATVVETPATPETATGADAKPPTSEAATDTAAKSAEGAATSGEAASGTAATTTTTETAVAAGGTHVIARGDTLWDIAKAAYGDGTLWRRIAEANGNPRPRALHVGTELSIPTK